MQPTDYLWELKYRPKLDGCILPKEFKEDLKREVKTGQISNYLFESTRPGTGKTTTALALAGAIDADVLFINASKDAGIEELRSRVQGFASTVSITGSPKVVILDEFDSATDQFQAAFRGFLEEFSDNCRFILTCNYANKIIEPIRNRLKIKTFIFPDDEKSELMKQTAKYCLDILNKENIEITDKRIIGELVKKHYPCIRSTIITLQEYSAKGIIDEGVLGKLQNNDSIDELIAALKNKKFGDVNKLIPKFASDYAGFITSFYNRSKPLLDPQELIAFIEILGENQCYATQVPDIELHLRYLCVMIMKEVGFK